MRCIFGLIIILFHVNSSEKNEIIFIQEDPRKEIIEYSGWKIELFLKRGYERREFKSEIESKMVGFIYLDMSYITVFCGVMSELDMESDSIRHKLTYENKTNGCIQRKGVSLETGNYWRKDKYISNSPTITVSYENISQSQVNEFDSILNNIKMTKGAKCSTH